MDKKICVVTATRAEYGLLSPIIKRLKSEEGIKVYVAVTGTHLSPEFGLTYREIEADGVRIDKKIEIILSSDTPTAVSKSMALALFGFSDYFEEIRPDTVLLLGDRYEMLAVASAAMNARIPICHLYGGETTEGAVDEAIRHAITKMSCLHFTSTQAYRKRVIQMGERPDRVFCVGAMGIENIRNIPLMTREEIAKELGMKPEQPYAVVTFHPVTLEGKEENAFKELTGALSCFKHMKFIFTKANADAGGRLINHLIDQYVMEEPRAAAYESLGARRYLSAVSYSEMVIGNSSSGIVEVPSFHVPTINIGDRQKGRIQAESVINCEAKSQEIVEAIHKANTAEFRERIKTCNNPYGDGNTSEKIVRTLKRFLENGGMELKKKFYDME